MKKFILIICAVIFCSSATAGLFGADWVKRMKEATLLVQQGDVNQAIEVANEALELAIKKDNKNHLNEATVLDNLGAFYLIEVEGENRAEKAKKAETCLTRSLAIKEIYFGKTSQETIPTLLNLAVAYSDQAKFTQSNSVLIRAIDVAKLLVGENNPDVATLMNNLARNYEDQGLFAEAESIYKTSLQIRENTLGSSHPDIAQSLENLARLYSKIDRNSEAEKLKARAVEIRMGD